MASVKGVHCLLYCSVSEWHFKVVFSISHNELNFIFWDIQNASDQKTEMEKIKGKMAQEVSKIEERKAKIDDELKEVQVMCLFDLWDQSST